jgi:hypothetical protein
MEIRQPELAVLYPQDGGKPIIRFMFNPSELNIQENNQPQDNPGANNLDSGRPKVSFAVKKSSILNMSEVIFDTYEEGEDVIAKYIYAFKEGMTFIEAMKRPPVYRFVWGNQQYMRRCFIQNFSYKLTKFLPDGTPVRAVVDLSLREAEDPQPNNQAGRGAPNPNRTQRSNPGGASLFRGP